MPDFRHGEVDDGFLWAGDEITISGMTLHEAGDDDWFRWDADDEWYDNVSITVTVGVSEVHGFEVQVAGDRNATRARDRRAIHQIEPPDTNGLVTNQNVGLAIAVKVSE